MRYACFIAMLLALAGCNPAGVRTGDGVSALPSPGSSGADVVDTLPEYLLPDVGVDYFEVALAEDDSELVDPAVHDAEARYLPWLLVRTLQGRRAWGVVRLNPGHISQSDVAVRGRILASDGARLILEITASDATGRRWFQRRYEGRADRSDYARESAAAVEPFQNLYDRIADDLMTFRRTLSTSEIAEIRQVAELKFAMGFAPGIFSGYLEDRAGRWTMVRQPARDDPYLARVRQVRERDFLFVDTLQDYHGAYALEMEGPYYDLRRELLIESAELRDARQAATLKTVGGALAILAGILAQGSDSAITQAAGAVGIGAGAIAVQEGFRQRGESQAYADAIREISRSFGGDMTEHRVQLEDRTVTLTGTLQQQAARWREILQDIYDTETLPQPDLVPSPAPPSREDAMPGDGVSSA